MRSEPMSGMLWEESDSMLGTATKNGESRAFEFLVHRHETKLFAIAFRITRNREDDVVQQSFYKAFMHLDTFQGRSSLSTWLTSIVINEALMFLRKNRTLKEVSLDDMKPDRETASPAEIADTDQTPAEEYEKHEKERILSQAINQLNSESRTALFLRLEDLTFEQAAAILGVRIGTLKARLFRARQRLRMLLAPVLDSRRRPKVPIYGGLPGIQLRKTLKKRRNMRQLGLNVSVKRKRWSLRRHRHDTLCKF